MARLILKSQTDPKKEALKAKLANPRNQIRIRNYRIWLGVSIIVNIGLSLALIIYN